MEIRSSDLVSLFEQALNGQPDKKLEEIGIVVQVGDNMCRVTGLMNAAYGEVIEFEGGNKGIIFDLGLELVSIFLLYNNISVSEGEVAKITGEMFKAPVGMDLLGRVINARGTPIDSLGVIKAIEYKNVEAQIPDVITRSSINEPLQTGQIVIDALVPIGRGQRELIIGDRNTGKTALAIDTILNQKDKSVYCVYVSIGQRQSTLAKIVALLEQKGALEYTIIISADASEPVLNQYLAPYVGCTVAEYFRDLGKDALIVYDDLTNHAVAYREMSLLMRRPPSREAYPGDVFYLHSRLLERAGKLLNGGSLTALPIVQIQGDDITAYIPTNLISITDGQIFLDTKLFNQGIRPAVNVELSVSRIGSAAQTKAIKQMTRGLRLDLAQYHELLSFAQFGTELDENSQEQLHRGAVAIEILKQNRYEIYSFVDEALILFAFKEGFLNKLKIKNVNRWSTGFISYVKSVYKDIYDQILETKEVSGELTVRLSEVAQEFSKVFAE